MRNCFDNKFPDRRIGRGGPISWPPRSQNITLNLLMFVFVGIVVGKIYATENLDCHYLINRYDR
jgi:hypothetical protein